MVSAAVDAAGAVLRIERMVRKLRAAYPELARRAAIDSRRDGQPRAQAFDTPSAPTRPVPAGEESAIDYADPTPAAAMAPNRVDDVSRRMRRAYLEVERVERALTRALMHLEEPTPIDDNGGQWCASCARCTNDDGRPYLTPSHPKIKGSTTVGGRLVVALMLCRWCYDFVEHDGVLPSVPIVREYLTRGKTPKRHG